MKEKMLEFLLKRIGSKVENIRHDADIDNVADAYLDDIDVYLTELKSLLADLML